MNFNSFNVLAGGGLLQKLQGVEIHGLRCRHGDGGPDPAQIRPVCGDGSLPSFRVASW
jgi:hypothetical protein